MDEELKAGNPWLHLTEGNIARCDELYIEKIKNKHKKAGLAFECPPEPYSGNYKSKVYCLNMNPGEPDPDFHGDENFDNESKKNLALKYKGCFWTDKLVNKQGKEHAGVEWLRRRTQDICKVSYDDLKGTTKDDIFFIEYFPYHSKYGFNFPKHLPSYDFSDKLIRDAIKEDKVFIIMRQVGKWLRRIPELETYPKLYVLNSPQCAYLSPKNIISYKEYLKKKTKK